MSESGYSAAGGGTPVILTRGRVHKSAQSWIPSAFAQGFGAKWQKCVKVTNSHLLRARVVNQRRVRSSPRYSCSSVIMGHFARSLSKHHLILPDFPPGFPLTFLEEPSQVWAGLSVTGSLPRPREASEPRVLLLATVRGVHHGSSRCAGWWCTQEQYPGPVPPPVHLPSYTPRVHPASLHRHHTDRQRYQVQQEQEQEYHWAELPSVLLGKRSTTGQSYPQSSRRRGILGYS